MRYYRVATVAGFASVFFFLPSLALKLWNYLIYAPWRSKSFIVYALLGIGLIWLVRRRFRIHRQMSEEPADDVRPISLAKQRLASGEISLEEFRLIKQELLDCSEIQPKKRLKYFVKL